MQTNKAKDFFINLGAIVALYTTAITLVRLLFVIIDNAYPRISNAYYYLNTSANISWPVAVLVIFFPILIVMMWLLEQSYKVEPERQYMGIHKWLSYLTLFVAGLVFAGDLITVLYYFINGEELTTGFLLKVLVILVVTGGIFAYYITDIRGQLTGSKRKMWRVAATVIVLGSIIWGFSVLGSPRTQRLYRYDETKVSDLMNLSSYIESYFYSTNALPASLSDLANSQQYITVPIDSQSGQSYEYKKISNTKYSLCATFNKSTRNADELTKGGSYPVAYQTWNHPEGNFCYERTVQPVSGKLPM